MVLVCADLMEVPRNNWPPCSLERDQILNDFLSVLVEDSVTHVRVAPETHLEEFLEHTVGGRRT